jgi:hypothetical protein
MQLVSHNLDTLGRSYDFFTWNTFLRLVRYPILHRVYLQIYDDPEAEIFTKDTLLISINSLWSSGSEKLQKKNYSENSTMNQFRMIPERYLVQDVSPKV